ncbi:MAG: hypothetical protein ACTSQO_04105 [Candidatus Helarchaeota archaeon]
MIVKSFKDAIKQISNIIEIEKIAVYNGNKVKFSNFEHKEMNKIFRSIETALNNIGFDIECQELEIHNGNKLLKFFLNNGNILVIKFTTDQIINKMIINDGVSAIFQFINT